jgi:TRAP-type C4-dicarboxylate transport system permease small subunit
VNYLVVLFHKLENALLYSVVIGLVSISLSQIWLRNVHDSGIYWGDSALRVLVFWLAMVGAMVASRETGHISIDALSRYLSPLWRKITATSTSVLVHRYVLLLHGIVIYSLKMNVNLVISPLPISRSGGVKRLCQ